MSAKGKEESFHDQWAQTIHQDDILVEESFESCVSPENRLIIKRLGDLKDKKILELGCGAGEASVYFAKKGAFVTATDISAGMLDITGKLADRFHVGVLLKKSESGKIDFDDESFDIVYAANLLHHVDIDETLQEASRVLKKGGVFVSWDPLAYNPFINVYRRLAKNVRTEGEHPIKAEDLRLFKKHFSRVEFDMAWLFTLWIFLRFYLFDRVDPGKERYWKKILLEHKRLEKIHNRLEKIDCVFLKWFPFMRWFCWNIVIFGYK
jgi:SAM-dependent methyltransferase